MNISQVMKGIALAGASALLSVCQAADGNEAAASLHHNGLVVTTWNVEHLAYPATDGCTPRTDAEMEKLKAYASSLESDIVALQEVASLKAAAQLFPESDWQLFISEREDSPAYICRKSGRESTQQKVAFAVRKGIKVNDVNTFSPLGLDMVGLRHGLELDVDSELGTISLLNVHMKSGCFVDNYSREEKEACEIFAKQAPILDSWVEAKEKQDSTYVVLGDFNHRLSAPYNRLTMELMKNSDNTVSSLVNTSADMIGCHPYYPAPIDHILVGGFKGDLSKSSTAILFDDMDPKAMLSDHCAVSFELTIPQHPLSTAVKWQVESKEYGYLTRSIYQGATNTINRKPLPNTPWVVMMDIDETVLNNVAYQVGIEQAGQTYHPDTWAAWVKSEKATLVPGVKGFIETVLNKGGKLALVTNRDRTLDHHTWRNLQALGLPVSPENTCLMGRTAEDKSKIDHSMIVNDKDLRRQQIEAGTASCYASANKRHSNFSAHKIVMQVGDNIEDFAKVTQEDADAEALLSSSDGSLVLLPNAMYGSW
ncbi:HAD family acid phosphatase [Thalassotalea euphylliae]|uniref:HAD family acid phosphatase n=1 Tax=Thalassotalea euphylliae TaxID=1655234 RepID=UPI00362B347E